ncbi:MAG: hypothetical protein KGZ88_10545 [Methylomicrobium sp.]|nr:hypothetical protein [Methylomicrobium sp.]
MAAEETRESIANEICAISAPTITDLVAKLELPRIDWMMVPTTVVDSIITDNADHFQ